MGEGDKPGSNVRHTNLNWESVTSSMDHGNDTDPENC